MILSRQSVWIQLVPQALRGCMHCLVASREVIGAGSCIDQASLPMCAITVTTAGRAHAVSGRQAITYEPGSMVIYPAGIPLREVVGPQADWHEVFLLLDGAWADALSALIQPRGVNAFCYNPAPRAWRNIVEQVVDAALEQKPGWEWTIASLLGELIGHVSRQPGLRGMTRGLLEDVTELIESDYGRAWTLPALSEELGLPERTLCRRFVELTGTPLGQWIRRHRIDSATRLLHRGMSVKEVAHQTGFANPFHFSRVFRSMTGVSPSSLHSQYIRTVTRDKK
jgi:AraC-like DNA-binding protein